MIASARRLCSSRVHLALVTGVVLGGLAACGVESHDRRAGDEASEEALELAKKKPKPKPTPPTVCSQNYPAGSAGAIYCESNRNCVIPTPPVSGPRLPSLGKVVGGIGVPSQLNVDYQCTAQDIRRPPTCPAPPGTSSGKNPVAVSLPRFDGNGNYVGCSVRVECDEFLKLPMTKKKDLRTPKLTDNAKHEACHCNDYFNGTPTSEQGADACAAAWPPKPRPTPTATPTPQPAPTATPKPTPTPTQTPKPTTTPTPRPTLTPTPRPTLTPTPRPTQTPRPTGPVPVTPSPAL
jgi:hypothetical protein